MFIDSDKTVAEIDADIKAAKKAKKKTKAAEAKRMVVDAADIQSIEGVNEVPEGAEVYDSAEIAGDSPIVVEFLRSLGD